MSNERGGFRRSADQWLREIILWLAYEIIGQRLVDLLLGQNQIERRQDRGARKENQKDRKSSVFFGKKWKPEMSKFSFFAEISIKNSLLAI